MFERSWVQIPAQYTGWTFFHINLFKSCSDVKTENKQKEAEDGPFLMKKIEEKNKPSLHWL